MVAFSWNSWVVAMRQIGRVRKVRRPRVQSIEGLEDRTLLTANLPVANNDTYQVIAGETLSGSSVLGNDTDADGDLITEAVFVTDVSHGTLTLQTNGTFTYIPDSGFTGADSFTYRARDPINNELSLNAATVTINVGSDNTPPVALPFNINVTADTTFAGGLDGSDADSDQLTYSQGAVIATNGTVVINPGGTFTYQPAAGFTGSDSFSYKVNDGTTDSAEALVTVLVGSASNRAPVATSIDINATVDTVFAGSLSGTDPDGDPLTFNPGSMIASHGTVSISPNGNFTYTPNVGYTGTDSFSFSVSDGVFNSTTDGIVSVTVGTGGNTQPVANGVTIDVGFNTPFVGGLSASDTDGDELVFSAGTVIPAHGTLTIDPSGSFTYTPQTGYTGTDTFSFKVNDGTIDSNEAIMSVNIGTTGNTAPVATPTDINVTLNTTFAGGLSGTDSDGDELTFSAGTTAAQHGVVVIDADGSFTYAPTAGYTGTDSFTFKVNDGTTNSAEATVTVLVSATGNSAPVATPTNISVTLNTAFAGGLSGTDADGDDLIYSAGAVSPMHGVLSIQPDGSFIYTPDTGYTGTDSFTFKVNDGTVNSADATVSVVVSGTGNTSPVATPISINVALNTPFMGGLSGTDADGDDLIFSAGATGPSHGTVSIQSDGTFVYTPTTGFTGTDSFTFKVNDGTSNSVDATVSVLVSATGNIAPVATPTNINVTENTAFEGGLSGTDANGDTLLFFAGSTGPSHGTVNIATDGTFTYTPDAGFTGTDSFTFRVSDGTANSADATVSILVSTRVNTPPVATPVAINVGADTPFTGSLGGTDVDGDDLTFMAGATSPANGTVVINLDGSFTYTPNSGYTGSDSFSFKVNDGTADSADATVTVLVGTSGNTLPIANPATFHSSLDVVFNGTLTGSDIDGDTLEFAAGNISPAHGTVTINQDGTFTYTPDAGFVGNDSFNFTVNDGSLTSSAATVIIQVAGSSNVAPTVTTGSGTVTANVGLNGSVSPLAIDANGDPLTFTVETPPAHGVLTLSPDGTFLYVPDPDYTGDDSFTFKANDGLLDSNVATFNLTVVAETAGFTVVLSSEPGVIATKIRDVTPLDVNATLVNVDPNVVFANASVTASIVSGADRRDRFVLRDGGTVDIRGRKIRVNGVEVARISGGRRGQALQVAFNASADVDSVQAVVQRIGLKTARNASSNSRVVQITVNADGTSNSATIVANKA